MCHGFGTSVSHIEVNAPLRCSLETSHRTAWQTGEVVQRPGVLTELERVVMTSL